jgi:hypothetical protein
MKLREMSFESHPVSILPNDKRIEIAGFSANDVENCFAGLVEEGLLEQGSTVDDEGNLVFTGLSTSGHDTVGAINPEFRNARVRANARASLKCRVRW